MNMLSPLLAAETMLSRTEVAGLVALAARTVPPLWPLESAIAVNPLGGFEERPFAQAVKDAAATFSARATLPLGTWRKLFVQGRIDERSLRDVAIRQLGGTYQALASIAPGVMAIDLLIARLLEVEPHEAEVCDDLLAPDAAFIAKWCGAFFDQTISATPMPNRKLGLYRAVLSLAQHDPEYRKLAGAAGATLLLTAPRDPYEAIAEGLADSGDERDPLVRLSSLVARLPGWAGHIRWRAEYADKDRVRAAPASMADLVALWVLLERAGALSDLPQRQPSPSAARQLGAHFSLRAESLEPSKKKCFAAIADLNDEELGSLFMTAAEWSYANMLLPQLERSTPKPEKERRPDAQLVMCIDVRSEPFRWQFEQAGNYETFGYAGFFGLPIALHPAGGGIRKRLLPVLLSPQHDVSERAAADAGDEASDLAIKYERSVRASSIFDAAKLGTASAFATAEATGPVAGFAMLARTVAPRLGDKARARRAERRHEAFEPKLDDAFAGGFSLEEKIGYAGALFRLTGMMPHTARLVVLAGHGGSAVNNPYAAALDCGACGGHAGGPNARLLAAMLNDLEVRAGLAENGIVLPSDTYFLAAQHDTTTDAVTIFDRCRVPTSHRADLASLEQTLAGAGDANRAWRSELLGRSPEDLLTGAAHWGEIRPEWGLAGNAAFLVGPRSWSKPIDLGGRAFLHSYDWREDESGEALTTILTAPMVVAQWINCQYLFSTIDNGKYGSGDKVTQNVLGGIGVVQGNGGDLKVGLPYQSLFTDDGNPYHVPQRLLTVVLAPLRRVQAVIEANDILGRLFGKGWVQLVVVDPQTGKGLRWREDAAEPGEGSTIHSISC